MFVFVSALVIPVRVIPSAGGTSWLLRTVSEALMLSSGDIASLAKLESRPADA